MIKVPNPGILPIGGWFVEHIRINSSFSLTVESPPGPPRIDILDLVHYPEYSDIVISGVFTYCDGNGETWILDPEGPRPELGPALAVFGLSVERGIVHGNGRLDLAFSDGSTITVEADPQYQAWDFYEV